MEYIESKGHADHPLFLLFHGTGGDEYDLLGLMALLDEKAGYLSFRGEVNEHGLLRFFKRIRPGVFDEEDLIERTRQYVTELQNLLDTKKTPQQDAVALGYSNGANFVASMLYHNEKRLKKCVLLHPMVPYQSIKPSDLSGVNVFIGAGSNDPICPYSEALQLKKDLEAAGAAVTLFTTDQGHGITDAELQAANAWLKT
jgi:phospholipase/carboxylesterase